MVDEGNIVQPGGDGTKLLAIQRVTPIYADFVMPEQHLTRVRQQMAKDVLKTHIWLPDETEATAAEGELTFLDNITRERYIKETGQNPWAKKPGGE